MLDVTFFLKDFFCSIAKSFHIGLFDLFAFLQLFDPLIEIVIRWGTTLSSGGSHIPNYNKNIYFNNY